MPDEADKVKVDGMLPRGLAYNFMPVPMMERYAEWFDAGPVAFAVEARILESGEDFSIGGGSIHVFTADHSQELVRFDCFDDEPHYHYLDHTKNVNTVWTFDETMNGPMLPWTIGAIRDRLPGMLRTAGAGALADRVEQQGFDRSVLEKVEAAVIGASERSSYDEGMLEESRAWFQRWIDENPHVVQQSA